MEPVRVLVAQSDPVQRTTLVQSLGRKQGVTVVGEAEDGAAAIQMIHERRPEVVICDIVMPHMDGFAVLKEVAGMDVLHRPKVITLTILNRDDFITYAIGLGASYYMVKPVDVDLLVQRIMRLAGTPMRETGAPARSAEQAVADMLMHIGMPTHLKGYRFLLQSVLEVLACPASLGHITYGLYPAVADRFDTTASRVERSIRHAINMTWDRSGAAAFERALSRRTFSGCDKPTNCELIALLAERVRLSGAV